MNGKQVIRILKKSGWYVDGIHGSHHKMKKKGYPPIIVPVHGKKDLKPGTLKNIERCTGVFLKHKVR